MAGDTYWSSVSLLVPFDGTNGGSTITDAKSGANLTRNGVTTATDIVKFGTAAGKFDGSFAPGGPVVLPTNSNLTLTGDFTIEFWTYAASSGYANGVCQLGSNYSPGGINNQIQINCDNARHVGMYDGSSWKQTTATYTPASNTWICWAFARSGSTLRIYANGTRIGNDITGVTGTFDFSAGAIGDLRGAGAGFAGRMDDLRITKGVARYTGSTYTVPTAAFDTSGAANSVNTIPASPAPVPARITRTVSTVPANPASTPARISSLRFIATVPAIPTAPGAALWRTLAALSADPAPFPALIAHAIPTVPAAPGAASALIVRLLATVPATPTAYPVQVVVMGRAIDDADYAAWLAGNPVRCLLAELECWHAGAVTTRYLGNIGWQSGQYDTPANQPYDPLLAEEPTISWSIDQALTAQDIQVVNRDGSLDGWLDDAWDGRRITLWLGDPAWSRQDFRLVFSGVLDGIASADPGTLTLKVRDATERLNQPVQSNLIADGPHANTPKPLAFGRPFNLTPVLDGTGRYLIHDGAVQAVSAARDKAAPTAVVPDLAGGAFDLADGALGDITVDAWGVGTTGGAPATGLAAWVSGLTWALGHPITGASAVRYDGAAVSGYSVANSSGSVTLPAALFTVVADTLGPTGSANLTGTCDGTTRFGFPTLAQYGGAYAQSLANVRIGSTPASATPDLVDCAVTLAHPLPLTVEFLMYNRYDSPEDAGAYWLTATHISGNTYRVPLHFSGQYVAQVNVGGVPLTDLVIDVPPGMDPAQTDVDLDNLTGLTVTADGVRFQETTGAAMGHVSGLTWALAAGTVLAFTGVRLDGASVAFTADTGARRVTLGDPPGGTVEIDFEAMEIGAAGIVQALATRSGLLSTDDLDAAAFADFAVRVPAPLGWYQTNTQRNAVECIDEIVAGVGAYRHFDRLGKLRLWRLDAPAGEPARVFDADDIVRDSLRILKVDAPAKRVRVQCRRNWTVQAVGNMQGSVADADKARYSAEYLLPPAVATHDLAAAHPNALDPDPLPSFYVEAADAQAEADRLAGLRSVPRTTYQADFLGRAIGLELGDLIEVAHPRFGLAGGKLAIVVGIAERPGVAPPAAPVTLTFWR